MRLTTAKRMETDGLSGEIHVAADESMRPKGVDPEGTAEQADGAGLRTAADEDDRSHRMGLQVGPPGGRVDLTRFGGYLSSEGGRRSPCPGPVDHIPLSSGAGSSSWCGAARRPRTWRGSSSRRPMPSATGSCRPPGTRGAARMA